MDSHDSAVQPDLHVHADGASTCSSTQKAPIATTSPPPSSSLDDASSSSTLHSSRPSSAGKRKRPSPPSSSTQLHQTTRPHKKTKHDDDDNDEMPFFAKKKKNKASASNDPSPLDTTADDITTTSKRGKFKSTAANTTAMPSYRNTARSMFSRKKTKQSEPSTAMPMPSSSNTYAMSSTPSIDLTVPDPYPSMDSLDADPDLDFMDEPVTLNVGEAMDDLSRRNDDLSADVDNLNGLVHQVCDKLKKCQQDKLAMERDIHTIREGWAKIGMDAMLERLRVQAACKKDLDAERARRIKAKTNHELVTKLLTEAHTHQVNELKGKHADLEKAHDALMERATHLARRATTAEAQVRDLELENASIRITLANTEKDLFDMAQVKASEIDEQIQSRDLPPAYGTIDDYDNFPPWARHRDKGSVQVALVKQTARQQFNKIVQSSMRTFQRASQSSDPRLHEVAGLNLFRELSASLSQLTTQLKPVMDYVGSPDDEEATEKGKTPAQDRSFFADRVAKLIIEFCWQFLASFSVRPVSLTISDASMPQLDIYWRAVDSTLTEALTIAFRDYYPQVKVGEHDACPQCRGTVCAGYCVRLNALSALFEQIAALAGHLMGLTDKFKFLALAWAWVEEAIEQDRKFAASAAQAVA